MMTELQHIQLSGPSPYTTSNLRENNKSPVQMMVSYALSSNNSSMDLPLEKKFQTLLPIVDTTSRIDNDLKWKLTKKFSFESEKSPITPTLTIPTITFEKSHNYTFETNTNIYLAPPTPSATPIGTPMGTPNVTPSATPPPQIATMTHPTSMEHLPVELVSKSHLSPSINNKTWQDKYNNNKQPIMMKITKKTKTDKNIAMKRQQNRRKHVCKICSTGFTTSGHLSRHNRIHTGEKNHSCPFEGCNQKFSRHDNCLQHYRTHLKKN